MRQKYEEYGEAAGGSWTVALWGTGHWRAGRWPGAEGDSRVPGTGWWPEAVAGTGPSAGCRSARNSEHPVVRSTGESGRPVLRASGRRAAGASAVGPDRSERVAQRAVPDHQGGAFGGELDLGAEAESGAQEGGDGGDVAYVGLGQHA